MLYKHLIIATFFPNPVISDIEIIRPQLHRFRLANEFSFLKTAKCLSKNILLSFRFCLRKFFASWGIQTLTSDRSLWSNIYQTKQLEQGIEEHTIIIKYCYVPLSFIAAPFTTNACKDNRIAIQELCGEHVFFFRYTLSKIYTFLTSADYLSVIHLI